MKTTLALLATTLLATQALAVTISIDRALTDSSTLVFDIDWSRWPTYGEDATESALDADELIAGETAYWHLTVRDEYPNSLRLMDVNVRNFFSPGNSWVESFSIRYAGQDRIFTGECSMDRGVYEVATDGRSGRFTYAFGVPDRGWTAGLLAMALAGMRWVRRGT